MSIICPTVTAYDIEEYKRQLDIISEFASRIHLDFMDGKFAPTKSIDIAKSWFSKKLTVDFHVMHQDIMAVADDIIRLHPNLVVVPIDAENVSGFIHKMIENGIKTGVALLQDTSVDSLTHYINVIDHVLIFSGNLGHHGGVADLKLLDKVKAVKQMRSNIEIGWDGGINDSNIVQISESGVGVLNTGGAITNNENPKNAYEKLNSLLQS